MQGNKLEAEEVIKVIDNIENNIANLKTESSEILKIEISRQSNNQALAENLKKFIEKDKSRVYDVKVEYDSNGLVKYIVLMIAKKDN